MSQAKTKTQEIVKPGRRGPVEGEDVVGFDQPPERRPGVPMAGNPSEAPGVAGEPLVLQEGRRDRRLHRAGLDGPTPVFGTAQPHQRLSGTIRSAAYDIPEHLARHWMLLLLADRVDTAEDRLAGALARPLEAAGADGVAERVRGHPFLSLGLLAAGVLVARRLLR